jgi:hypothetical protein
VKPGTPARSRAQHIVAGSQSASKIAATAECSHFTSLGYEMNKKVQLIPQETTAEAETVASGPKRIARFKRHAAKNLSGFKTPEMGSAANSNEMRFQSNDRMCLNSA